MKTTNELILELLKKEFNRNKLNLNDSNSSDNVWLMCAALIPFSENSDAADFLPYSLPGYVDYDKVDDEEIRGNLFKVGTPTHIVRIVLRNTWPTGTLPYVDGTDVYVTVSTEHQTADFIWEDVWIEAEPKYHGGTVGDSLEWVREMFEPFHTQIIDPFLNS
jgi:hypothetical protein